MLRALCAAAPSGRHGCTSCCRLRALCTSLPPWGDPDGALVQAQGPVHLLGDLDGVPGESQGTVHHHCQSSGTLPCTQGPLLPQPHL